MIKELKILHQKRQEQNSKSLHAKKQSAWSKIEATQEMVALAKNFRFFQTHPRYWHNTDAILRQIAIKSNMGKALEREVTDLKPNLDSQNLDRELSHSASRMRIAGKSVPQGRDQE